MTTTPIVSTLSTPDYAAFATVAGLAALSTLKTVIGTVHLIESIVHPHDALSIAIDVSTIISAAGAGALVVNAIWERRQKQTVYTDLENNQQHLPLSLRTKVILYAFTGLEAVETVLGIYHIIKVDDTFGKVHGAINTGLSLIQTVWSWGFLHFYPRPTIDAEQDKILVFEKITPINTELNPILE